MNPPPRPAISARAQTMANPATRQERNDSSSSDSSTSSQVTAVSNARPSPYILPDRAAASTTSLANSARMVPRYPHDLPLRHHVPSLGVLGPPTMHARRRSRQHSQGFFEPSLNKTSVTASIAAQAAMHIQSSHSRRRSQVISSPQSPKQPDLGKRKVTYPAPIHTLQHSASSLNVSQSRNAGNNGRHYSHSSTGATLPRSPLTSPDSGDESRALSPVSPETKREKTMMKLFKPKNAAEKKIQTSPSKEVTKSSTFPRMMSYSTTNLASPSVSAAPSIYSSAHPSTATLIPGEKTLPGEKEKHKHNFLSRQKQKLKEGSDHHHLMLSSASSNSRPTDPNAPQSLYSFAPSSPAPGSGFNKSISGLDLRHGGRALREKKREEKATASGFVAPVPISSLTSDSMLRDREHTVGGGSDWLGPASVQSHNFGPPSASSAFFPTSDSGLPTQGLSGLGLPGMTQDDAWPLLKARLLNIFEGEDLRTPVEDFNRLVTAHLQRCIQRRAPGIIVEDFRDLLHTGFTSLDLTLRQIPDDRLVPHLAGTWSFVFDMILPFMQAVFLPLEHEFKARSNSLGLRDLIDFWGVSLPSPVKASTTAKSPAPPKSPSHLAIPLEALSVRAIVLLMFRDVVIFPRHATLLGIFSHLSLDAMNFDTSSESRSFGNPSQRPGTSSSHISAAQHSTFEPASVTSQGSTLFDSSLAGSGSIGARSRATSNTSAGSFPSVHSPRQRPQQFTRPYAPTDPAKITQTAARMLQCMSVLAGLPGPGYMPSGGKTTALHGVEDVEAEVASRKKMEVLAKELKLNWLGRGRMGRNRMGFVGGRIRTPVAVGLGFGVGVAG